MFRKIGNWISNRWITWLTHERPAEGLPLCDFQRIRYELRAADVLLIEGRSQVSDIIRSITQSSWSHAALYVGRLHDVEDPKIRNIIASHYNVNPDMELLIEGIMGKGTIVSELASYENDHIRLCRPKGLSRQDAQKVIAFAAHKLGHEYDTRNVLDLARFLLPWTYFPRKFRSKLFEYHPGESTRTVCSTMIAEAFASVEFPILPLVKQHDKTGIELIARNPKLYTPRDFDYSPYFDILKYPFVEFADFALYRHLPWNREGLLSHDSVGIEPIGARKLAESTKKSYPLKINSLKINTLKTKFFKKKNKEDISSTSRVSTDSNGAAVSTTSAVSIASESTYANSDLANPSAHSVPSASALPIIPAPPSA